MKKILARLPVIIIGIPVVYWLLILAPNYFKILFFAIISILGQLELSNMLNHENKAKPIFEWLCTIVIMSASYFYGEKALFVSLFSCFIASMLRTVFRGLKGDGIKLFANSLFSLFYLPFCLSCFYLLALKLGGMALFIILASVWALDIGAYAFGMTFRGPKLAPKISPNKTISGAIGGFLCSVGFMCLATHMGWGNIPLPQAYYMAFAIATVGQIADLFESVIKRESDTKDSSSLLGAHGGILDRIDSVLFLGPICYFIITL